MVERTVLPRIVGRTGGLTAEGRWRGRFYHGIMVERAVLLIFGGEMALERAVLPWNHGRTGGSTNFSERNGACKHVSM